MGPDSLLTNPRDENRARRTIAIIGGGLSGTALAIQLLLQALADVHITIIERRQSLGRGVAYSTQFDSHLLNVRAGDMSILPDRPGHFVQWLNRSGRPWQATDFVPRRIYGDYVFDTLCDAQAHAGSQVKFSWIRSRAVDAQPTAGGLCIEMDNGRAIEAGLAVLSVGNSSRAAPLPGSDRAAIIQPWNWTELLEIPPTAPVLLIGSALTAVDVLLVLDDRGHCGPIHMVARRGLLPNAHREAAGSAPAAPLTDFPPTARGLLRLIRDLAEKMTQACGDWRPAVDAMRPHTVKIWQSLTLTEQRRLLRHVRPYWDVHRHRTAPAATTRISRMLGAGRLRMYAGRILSMRPAADTGRQMAEIKLRSGGNLALEFDYAINCAGTREDFRTWDNPLVRSLFARKMIQSDALDIGLCVDSNGRLIGIEDTSFPLFTLGPSLKGQLWETTAVPEIRKQARTLAQILLTTLDNRSRNRKARLGLSDCIGLCSIPPS
jgi:uncharacterized NAD(P)/FAD-binding protein YdhS